MTGELHEAEIRAARLASALDGLSQIAAAGGKLGQQTDIMTDALASVFDLLAHETKDIALLLDRATRTG